MSAQPTDKSLGYEQVKYLFFNGKYEECLSRIRHQLSIIKQWDKQTQQNLVILGAQCLYELERGEEILGFCEHSYQTTVLFLPPMVFFVWITYLSHNNEYDKCVQWLKEYKEKGRPMNQEEYAAYIRLLIYELYINHKKYKDALKFLKSEHRLEPTERNVLKEDIRTRARSDEWNNSKFNREKERGTENENEKDGKQVSDDMLDKSDEELDNENNTNQKPKQSHENIDSPKQNEQPSSSSSSSSAIAHNQSQLTNPSSPDQFPNYDTSQFANFRKNFVMFVAVAKKKQFGMAGIKFLIYFFILYCLWKILYANESNRKRMGIIIQDFKAMLQMGIGKSRISS